jgi:hypothetical protein
MIVQMSRAPSNYIARKLVLRHFAYGPSDVLCFILGLIIVGTLWRSLRLVESLQQVSLPKMNSFLSANSCHSRVENTKRCSNSSSTGFGTLY